MTTSVFKKVDYTLDFLLDLIDHGTIGLPDIQRPFVWQATRVRDLLDSMYKGFPVGYLLLWANPTTEGSKSIGTGVKQGSPDLLIVDGQQRLTSLYSIFKGQEVVRDDYSKSRIQIAFHPLRQAFEVTDAAIRKDVEWVPDVTELLRSGERRFVNGFIERLAAHRQANGSDLSDEEEDSIAKSLSRLKELEKYPFTALELAATLDEEQVADVFVRINSQGVKLEQADFILTLMSVHWE
jgi:uncharacterized protein with ParB-like and HNH nuclease domain